MDNNLLFIDESGDHSLNNINSDFPIFALLGLIIEESSYKILINEVNDFKNKYFKTTSVVLHSREIRKCEGVFAILFDLKVKEEFYKDLNSIITNTNFMLVSSAILTLAKRYNELLYKGSGVVSSGRFVNRYNQELLFKRKSQNDIGLQLADLCAYPIARHVLYPEEPYPAFEIIRSKIRNNRGKVEGFGIKIFP